MEILPVENRFFGTTVTVAGLLTGGDITAQLQAARAAGHDLGDEVLLPAVVVRDGAGDLLDGMRPEEISRALGLPVRLVPVDGARFLHHLIGIV